MGDETETGRHDRRVLRAGDLRIDVGQQRVERDGQVIPLPRLSFNLLLALAREAPDFVTLDALMSSIWAGLVVTPETVTQRVKLLRDALGDDARAPRYIEGLRGRGYRFLAPVGTPADEPGDAGIAAAITPPARSTTRRHWAWLAALLLPALLVGTLTNRWRGHLPNESSGLQATAPAERPSDRTVAVLPFGNITRLEADAFIGQSVADAILDRLSTVRGLIVIARESAATMAATTGDAHTIGVRLNAAYLVEGGVQHEGDQLRVSVRLLDSRDGLLLWSRQVDHALTDVFVIETEIAGDVARALEARIAGLDPARPFGKRSSNGEAYLAFLRGRALIGRFTVAEAEAAASEFSRAVELDPKFASAYVALYDARLQAAALRREPLAPIRAKNAALIDGALRLDPDSGAALFAKAMWADSDPPQRDADFRRAALLDPSNSRGLTAYSEFLDELERGDEARVVLEQALRVDPLAARAHFRLAQRNFRAVGAAIEQQTLHVLELDPKFYPALQRYAKYRWQLHGDAAQAVSFIERAISSDPQNPWGRHTAAAFYLDLGDPAAAEDVVRGSAVSEASTLAMRASYAGDWRTAGRAALADGSYAFSNAERWCVASALRDYALRSGDFARVMAVLSRRYSLPATEPWRLSPFNVREAGLLAHLLLAQGERVRATARLEEVIAWIDANPRFGPVYQMRAKAQALMLEGKTAEALELLASSFRELDYTHWWYTLERDPTWDSVRTDPRFVAIANAVHDHVAAQQATLSELRRRGTVPARPPRP